MASACHWQAFPPQWYGRRNVPNSQAVISKVSQMTFSSSQAKAGPPLVPCPNEAWVPAPQTEDQVAAGLRQALRKVLQEENTSTNDGQSNAVHPSE